MIAVNIGNNSCSTEILGEKKMKSGKQASWDINSTVEAFLNPYPLRKQRMTERNTNAFSFLPRASTRWCRDSSLSRWEFSLISFTKELTQTQSEMPLSRISSPTENTPSPPKNISENNCMKSLVGLAHSSLEPHVPEDRRLDTSASWEIGRKSLER